MGPCFKSYLSYKFAWPETMPDQAKMVLASHRVQILPEKKYFKPCGVSLIHSHI